MLKKGFDLTNIDDSLVNSKAMEIAEEKDLTLKAEKPQFVELESVTATDFCDFSEQQQKIKGMAENELALSVFDYFKYGGILQQRLENFTPRVQQLEFAVKVANTFNNKKNLLAEAGTGVGKTFAYLLPAILSGKKVLISTKTKILQQQIFESDLIELTRTLNLFPKVKILKGRANYACLMRLSRAANIGTGLIDHVRYNGDLDLINNVKTTLKHSISCEFDGCLRGKCPEYNNCYLYKARKEASESDLILINHSLFFSAKTLDEQESISIYPKNFDVAIFDEAHGLDDNANKSMRAATDFVKFSENIHELAKNYPIVLENAGYVSSLEMMADDMAEVVEIFDEYKDSLDNFDTNKYSNYTKLANIYGDIKELLEQINANLESLTESLGYIEFDDEDEQGNELHDKCIAQKDLFNRIMHDFKMDQVRSSQSGELSIKADPSQKMQYYLHKTSHAGKPAFFIEQQLLDLTVKQNYLFDPAKKWIFLSATLTTPMTASNLNDFKYFMRPFGFSFDKFDTIALKSPFNYSENAVFFVSKDTAHPQDKLYIEKLCKEVVPAIISNKGRCLFLCCSYENIDKVKSHLKALLPANFNLLVQEKGSSKEKLTYEFLTKDNAVLVATASFREGFNVVGDRLSLLIMDKIPFPRSDEFLMDLHSGDNFNKYTKPVGLIHFKQAIGRLIRSETDFGAVILGDRRILSNNHSMFQYLVDDFKKVANMQELIDFLREKNNLENNLDEN